MLTNLIIGLIFIGIGFLVKCYPNTIAGYNTMSEEKKKNIDIDGASSFMKKGFIILGIIIMVLPIFFRIINLRPFSSLIMLSIKPIGIAIIVIKAQKYNHNKEDKPLAYIVLGIVLFILFFTIGSISHAFIPTKAIFDEEKIEFTGSYGFTLNISDIETVELVDTIPKIKIRTNGVSVGQGYIHKGHYRLETWGLCRLLINSDRPPFLIITKKNGEKIIINNKEKTLTENIYRQIELLKE